MGASVGYSSVEPNPAPEKAPRPLPRPLKTEGPIEAEGYADAYPRRKLS